MGRERTDMVFVAGPVPANMVRTEHKGFLPWMGRSVRSFVFAVGRFGKRAITTLPWNYGGPSPSEATSDTALSLIPFFACIRLLADHIAAFPLHAFRETNGTRQKISDPQLFRRLPVEGTMFDWLHKCVTSLALRGNAYGLITIRDGMGFPTSIVWLNPDDVHVDELNPVMPRYYVRGNEIAREKIVHIPWFVVPGHVVGLSPVAAFARSIGAGLSASQFSKDWFDNGGQPPGTFQNKNKTINSTEADEIKNRLVTAIRSHKPIVYGNDWEYNVLRVTQEEAQFIQTQKLSATQMANIFGVPAEMVGGESGGPLTYNNLLEEGERLARFTLRPWLVRLEQAFSQLLPERQHVMFNLDALVRADIKSRYESYKVALEAGFMTIDEVRELEERPPLAGPTPVPAIVGNGEDEMSRVHYLPGVSDAR